MRAWKGIAFLLVCMELVPAVGYSQFLQEAIRPSVSVSERHVPSGSTFDVIADFELDVGVHVYKDRISFKWQELVAAEHVQNIFPEGKKVRDEFGPDRNAVVEVYEGSVRVVSRMRSTGKEGDAIKLLGELGYQGCTDRVCYPPETVPIEFNLATISPLPEEEIVAPAEREQPEAEIAPPEGKVEKAPAERRRGATWLILMAFAAGIGISLTPCVYPMIPITAAIVGGTKQKGKMGALLSSIVYVFGLSITYSILGLVVASGGVRVRTALSSPWVLVPIAGVFILLALSMFEVVSIQVQPKTISKWQKALPGKGRTLGIFAMGILSGLVAGPCVTAPLAGILVIVAKEANKLIGFSMLFALAWGMGIILVVAGMFTSALPKAGEWTLWVKKLLGFIMLWAAAYFISPVIGSMAYRAATAVVLVAAAVFLGGFDTLTKESGFADRAKRLMGVMAVLFAAYLILGGFAKEISKRLATMAPVERAGGFVEASYEDVEKAMASGEPVVLDFYATWCSICNHLDDETFRDPGVANVLENFHALKVDFDGEAQLVEKFKVPGVPTIVFIGSDGKEMENLRFSGFKTAQEFLEILKKVK